MALNRNKITTYNDKDPRYTFTIQDSNEYNTSILPFRFTSHCTERVIPTDPTLFTSCDSQRYEHCVHNSLDDKYIKCDLTIDNNNNHEKYFIPKIQNDDSYYFDTYVSKLENPDLEIDYSPDSNVTIDDKIKKTPSRLEHYVDSKSNESHNPFIITYCPIWLSSNDLFSVCLILCILCILYICYLL